MNDSNEMERSIDEYITRGYKIQSQNKSSTRLKKQDLGETSIHLFIAISTIWWTLGLANALYAIYKRMTADEIVVKIANDTTDIPESVQVNRDLKTSTLNMPTMNKKVPVRVFFQLFSLFFAGFVLLIIFTVHTGQIGLSYIRLALVTLTVAILFRYIAVYHQFEKPLYRWILIIPATISVVSSTVFAVKEFVDIVRLEHIWYLFQTDSFGFQSGGFLPVWWIATILVPAGLLILIGSFVHRSFTPYPRPTMIRTTDNSPVYFGFLCAFFGLWAVLFVGISIQRVVVIAPIFEELLKFGIALLVGSVLFDRSLLARIGVAAVVGSLFGLIEHATTYPAEQDSLYLFRTLFHMMSTVLSVSVYTFFESQDMDRIRWLAPILSILIHFFYNTFAVLSSLITIMLFGSQMTILTLAYGGVAILVLTSLIVLALLRHKAIRLLYMPIESVLSDLV